MECTVKVDMHIYLKEECPACPSLASGVAITLKAIRPLTLTTGIFLLQRQRWKSMQGWLELWMKRIPGMWIHYLITRQRAGRCVFFF